MAGPTVNFDKVVFCYDRTEVLHDVSFILNQGEIVGLLGPNGAGKTTTIKIIAGILTPDAGSVSVCGFPLPEQAVSIKQRIGYVPEAAALASDGKTILYSSHVLDVVEKVRARVVIIHEGNLIADGTPEHLKSSTQQFSLEDVFRKLTRSESVDPGISRIVAALRS